MKRLHLIFGIILLSVFFLTGLYMLNIFPDIYENSPEIRMMFRANHIYILFASLINLLFSTAIINNPKFVHGNIQAFSSTILIAGGALLVTAFFTETDSANFMRPLTFFGVLFHVISILTIVLTNLVMNKKKDD